MNADQKPAEKAPLNSNVRRVDLRDILGTEREIIILHRNEEYRLRLTSNDKLLLTK